MNVTLAKVSFLVLIAMFGASDALAHSCEKVLGQWLKDPKIATDDCHKDTKVQRLYQAINTCIRDNNPKKKTDEAKGAYDACKAAIVGCETGDDLSDCSKGSVRQVYVWNGLECYDRVDAKGEGGLFHFSKDWRSGPDSAPAVFRDPADCKKAENSRQAYNSCISDLVDESRDCRQDSICIEREKKKPIKLGRLEARNYAASFCEGKDGRIRIKFHFPPEKDRRTFEKEKREYQAEEAKKAKSKKTSGTPIVEKDPTPPAQEAK